MTVCAGNECRGYEGGSMCRRGVHRLLQWVECQEQGCARGYKKGQYVQERVAVGINVGSMCRGILQ